MKYNYECKKKDKLGIVDIGSTLSCKQIYGAPIGGIGAGSIGRTYTGEFARYQLVPGIYEHEIVDANMFTVCIRRKASTTYQQALTTRRLKQEGFKSWNMAYSPDQATYHALYPESWTVYELPGQDVTLVCHQLTPIIPHNYKDSSLPVGLFHWTVSNKHNRDDIELSLMFTWQSGSASDKFQLENVESRSFRDFRSHDTSITGVAISQTLKKMPLEYCISAKQTVILNTNKIFI